MFFAGMALGAMAGAAFGIGLMCCVVAGKREDQQMEQMRIRRQKQGEPKQIQFRDMEGTKRFILLDGESLCMMAEDGTKEIGLCRFVDEKQVDVDGQVAKSGLSREEFLRSLILGAQLQTKPCEHHAELLRKIAGLCNNANQLAHVANGTGRAGEASIQEMLRISKETWRLVKEEW